MTFGRVSWTKHVSPSFTSESSALLLANWPWINLKRPFERTINLDRVELTNGGNANVLKIAFSAARSLDSTWRSNLVLSLNGREIDIPSPRSVPNDLSSYDSKAIENMQHDRHFYDIPPITITENMRRDLIRVKLRARHDNVLLCHFYVWAYEHVSSNENSIGTFPVFDSEGKIVGYRPTKSNCIMRDMTSSTFCPVCRDAMMRKTLSITTKTKMMRGQSVTSLSNNPSSFQLVLASEILLFLFGQNSTIGSGKRTTVGSCRDLYSFHVCDIRSHDVARNIDECGGEYEQHDNSRCTSSSSSLQSSSIMGRSREQQRR